jgi:formamidopyrimidine-DNA glycosylase
MPELPEVETIVRDLQKELLQQRIEGVTLYLPRLIKTDPQQFQGDLRGRRIEAINRRGKNILLYLEEDWVFWIHLGMSGRLFLSSPQQPRIKHTHLILTFTDFAQELRYWDMRTFGWLYLGQKATVLNHPRLQRLGPEPLEMSLPSFQERLRQRQGKIKSLLLDQTLCAGLGNIYVDESLFAAQIHPARTVPTLTDSEIHHLHTAIQAILHRAIAHGGSTIANYARGDGSPGAFRHFHQVYGRQNDPCPRCGTSISRMTVSGRGTYFCPQCQPV